MKKQADRRQKFKDAAFKKRSAAAKKGALTRALNRGDFESEEQQRLMKERQAPYKDNPTGRSSANWYDPTYYPW